MIIDLHKNKSFLSSEKVDNTSFEDYFTFIYKKKFLNPWKLKKSSYFCIAFKSRFGALAQLVEHRTENPGVPGSIPGGTTKPRAAPIYRSGFFLFKTNIFQYNQTTFEILVTNEN
jgi:hypothetical protein